MRKRGSPSIASTLLGLLLCAVPLAARALESRDGRLRLAGEISSTLAPPDRGYFDSSGYENDTLRLCRMSLSGEFQPVPALALVAELRSDNLDAPSLYAAYVRVRPWQRRAFDVQVGRVPPVFGAFPRRRYASANPLPSVPLVYQYMTSLRNDAVPASVDELLANRGRGWRPRYSIGSQAEVSGLPFVDAERWDVGLEVRLGGGPIEAAAALTQGSPSRPLVRDDNAGKQLSARVAWRPSSAWVLGLSGADGAYLSRDALASLPDISGFRQSALGADVEYAYGYWILRAEAVWSSWDLPPLERPLPSTPVRGLGGYLEARYKITAGLVAAGRVEHLGFSHVATSSGAATWEAPVSRVELGLAYALQRQITLKCAFQANRRDAGAVRRQQSLIGQLVGWF
jgi:hypothetical protein